MSEYIAKVIEVQPKKHENADNLSICQIDGWTVCINNEDWINKDGSLKFKKAVHIQPDSLVLLSRDEFKWLKSTGIANLSAQQYRVKAKKLRGVASFGFLVPVDDSKETGSNMWEELQLDRWQPPEPSDNTQNVQAPRHRDFSKYDLQDLHRCSNWLLDDEEVVALEKFEGQNCRIYFQDDQIYVGSRNLWKADVENSDFWKSYRSVPTLENFIKENPQYCIFGESYGNVKGFPYDCNPSERKFVCFDIFDTTTNTWLNVLDMLEICKINNIPTASLIYKGPFNMELMLSLSEGKATLNQNHVKEGIVVSPIVERTTNRGERVKLKCKGLDYYSQK